MGGGKNSSVHKCPAHWIESCIFKLYFHSLGLINSLCDNVGLFVIQAHRQHYFQVLWNLTYFAFSLHTPPLKYTNYVTGRVCPFFIMPHICKMLHWRSLGVSVWGHKPSGLRSLLTSQALYWTSAFFFKNQCALQHYFIKLVSVTISININTVKFWS